MIINHRNRSEPRRVQTCAYKVLCFAFAALFASLFFTIGCHTKSLIRESSKASTATRSQYPPRPYVPPPPFKVFHQTADTFTLVTKDNATDEEIEALIWQLRDAAHNHTFDKLKINQMVVDARKPIVWFHIYRGAKCASEKYTSGKLPCDASYHGAGDYTFGDYTNPNWDQGALRHGDTETLLWNPDAQYSVKGT